MPSELGAIDLKAVSELAIAAVAAVVAVWLAWSVTRSRMRAAMRTALEALVGHVTTVQRSAERSAHIGIINGLQQENMKLRLDLTHEQDARLEAENKAKPVPRGLRRGRQGKQTTGE